MDQDGKNKIHLAEVYSDAPQAHFSPDGSKIVFVAVIDGIRQIHTVECTGKNETNLSRNRHHEFEPAFSPDGSRIAFVSDQDGTSSIMIMDSDGKNRMQLTDSSGEDRDPNFSPDGSHIVFSSERKRNSDIYLMESNGGHLKNLTNSASMENEPKFHPNGSKILFVSNQRGATHRDICSIDVKGQSYKNLTYKLNIANYFFDVSPDGKNIAFTSIQSDGCDIYVMDPEGKNPRNLSRHTAWDQNPSF
jgi:Tol biopolymer transport system component